MAGTLLDSETIKNEIKEKYKMIVEFYHQEVISIEEIFNKNYEQFKEIGFKVIVRSRKILTGKN